MTVDDTEGPTVVNAEAVALEALIDLAENAEEDRLRLDAAATLLAHVRHGAS